MKIWVSRMALGEEQNLKRVSVAGLHTRHWYGLDAELIYEYFVSYFRIEKSKLFRKSEHTISLH